MDIFQTILRALRRHLTPAARAILVANVAVFLVIVLLPWQGVLIDLLVEDPRLTLRRFQVWRLVSYMFLHVDGFHLLFNMILLWFFASQVEARLGTRRFWQFYICAGAGAGAVRSLLVWLTPAAHSQMLGASGALMGMLFAYACFFPNQVVLVWGLVPIRIKFLVAIIIGFDVFMLGSAGDSISRGTHLAGVGVAYLWLARHYRTPDLRRWRWMQRAA